MAATGFYKDAPKKIVSEGRTIDAKFTRLSNDTGRISWTLPTSPGGCKDPELKFNGVIVVGNTNLINLKQSPVDGQQYVGDPTMDTSLFAGDKLAEAQVLYTGYGDTTTTYIDVTGLQASQAYFFAVFAVDNVYQYHTEGAHTYSTKYGDQLTSDTTATHEVKFGTTETDLVGLPLPGPYKFVLRGANDVRTLITITPTPLMTFRDLVDEINRQLNVAAATYVNENAPNVNQFFFVDGKLTTWDGFTFVPVTNAIIEQNDPTTPTIGDLWIENNQLREWDGVNWNFKQFDKTDHEYQVPRCDDIWFNGTTAYAWNNTIWKQLPTIVSTFDPASTPVMSCNSYWYDVTSTKLYAWTTFDNACSIDDAPGSWKQTTALVYGTDPRALADGEYWFNTSNNTLNIKTLSVWTTASATISVTQPMAASVGALWFNVATQELFVYSITNTWTEINCVVWATQPDILVSGELWWDITANALKMWDTLTSAWITVTGFHQQSTDPSLPSLPQTGTMWYNPSSTLMEQWDGSDWCSKMYVTGNTPPTVSIISGKVYFNTVQSQFYKYTGSNWVAVTPTSSSTPPHLPAAGTYWINPVTDQVNMWNGVAWVSVLVSTISPEPSNGTIWYKPSTKQLRYWSSRYGWQDILPEITCSWSTTGSLIFETSKKGSSAIVQVMNPDEVTVLSSNFLFNFTNPKGTIEYYQIGTDGVESAPMYDIVGVGTDGSSDERRAMVESILIELGHPVVQVELTKQQLEFCIDQAIQYLRRRSGASYDRSFFFLQLEPGKQHYTLSNKAQGFDRIVDIQAIRRQSSAFFSRVEGQGMYGQMVLQSLYQMGTYDLTSYHIISEYTELMERMFAVNIRYYWHEKTRKLSLMQNIHRYETVLVEATAERTEQDMLADRRLSNWIQTWAVAEARMILAEIRGKYASLPGAGGGITLNANDLRNQAREDFDQCKEEIDNFVADDIVSYGASAQFLIG